MAGHSKWATVAAVSFVAWGVAMIMGGMFPMPDERHGGFGLGLAVPINSTTRQIMSELVSTGRVRRAYLGIAGTPAPLPPPLAARLGQRRGLRLVEVVPGGPAAAAGLFLGDILIAAGGKPVQGVQDVQRLMLGSTIGTRLPMTVLRRGAFVDVVAVPAPLE